MSESFPGVDASHCGERGAVHKGYPLVPGTAGFIGATGVKTRGQAFRL